MVELDFEKLFKVPLTVMKWCRCHPDTNIDKYWLLWNLMVFTPYAISIWVLTNSTIIYLKRDDYYNCLKNSVPVTFFMCIGLYYCLLMINRPLINTLMKSVQNDYTKALVMDPRRQSIMLEHFTKGGNIVKTWFSLVIGSIAVFILKPMILSFYYTHKSGELKLVPLYELEYPLNFNEYKNNNIYIFGLCFCNELHFINVCTLIYSCTVPPGLILMVHACGQLELIKLKFENIFEYDDVEDRLKDIVKDLQYVYSFVRNINKCYTLVYEVLLKQSMLLLPFTSYAIIQSFNHGSLTIEYVSLFVQAVFTSSIPCYYADLLMEKGEEVRLVAYSCGWERVPNIKARKTLLIILTRTQRPICIETIFTKISLDTLTNVYRQAYTIFNLMTAMW